MTIHAFCLSVLRENAFESGTYFDMELLADSPGFLRQTVMDFFGARINDLDPLLLAWFQSEGITPENFEREFRTVVARSGIRTLPGTARFRDNCDEYREVVRQMAAVLARDGGSLAALILDHPGLDKRSYSKRNVPAWLEKCRQALENAGEATLFNMTEKGDAPYKFTRSRLAEKTKKGAPPDHEFFDLCQQLLEHSRVLRENLVRVRLDFLAFYQKALSELKKARSECFFDDLINDVWAALDTEGGGALRQAVLNRYKACLIDEFQDTDPVQYRIFSRLFSRDARLPFFMIGDPKQAIYAFRGGDIFAYLSARSQASGRFTLGVNYRSAPGLVRAVNHLFLSTPNPFGFKEIPFLPVKTPEGAMERFRAGENSVPPLQMAFIDREGLPTGRDGRITKTDAAARVPHVMARDILSLLTDGIHILAGEEDGRAPGPGDMAVLVRTNAQAQAVHQALSQRGIPAFVSKTGSVFDSPQALELFDLLSAAASPDKPGLVKAALAGSLFGCHAEILASMDWDQTLSDFWQERFARFNQLLMGRGFTSMINEVFHGSEISPVPGTGCSERALTNFYHLAELVSKAALAYGISGKALLSWYTKQLSAETREEGADELRLESDGEAVAIVTIHKSKGLEYPIVFLPFLWDKSRGGGKNPTALFHDPEAEFTLTLDLGSEDLESSQQLAAVEQEAEEMRLLYVALTRASAMCRIYWAGVTGCDGSALGTLLHPRGAGEDAAMKAEILSMADGADQAFALTAPKVPEPGAAYTKDAVRSRGFKARPFDRQVVPAWRITSYSGLVRQQGELGSDFTGEQFAWEEVRDDLDVGIPEEAGRDPILLDSFPKGAVAGDFFHHVLETIDFTRPRDIEPAVGGALDRYGFAKERYQAQALAGVKEIIAAPLVDQWGNGFSLDQVRPEHCFKELEFCFNLRQWDTRGLAEAFASEKELKAYAGRLQQMQMNDIKGFLKGFIDLVVRRGNRWYIMDYKSNYLGPEYRDYSPGAMAGAMISHDYLLQFHLYLIALDRYLALRVKEYAYETHFGGGFYLFIRGMRPGGGTGIYYNCPSNAFMARLRDLV